MCIDGRFVYTARRKSFKAGHTKTEAYVGDQGRGDARFCLGGFREASGGYDSARTSK